MVTMIEVQNSKAVKKIGYDKAKSTMYIQFADSPLYAYLDVNSTVFKNFANSDSKGRFWHKEIKGEYKEIRLDN